MHLCGSRVDHWGGQEDPFPLDHMRIVCETSGCIPFSIHPSPETELHGGLPFLQSRERETGEQPITKPWEEARVNSLGFPSETYPRWKSLPKHKQIRWNDAWMNECMNERTTPLTWKGCSLQLRGRRREAQQGRNPADNHCSPPDKHCREIAATPHPWEGLVVSPLILCWNPALQWDGVDSGCPGGN